ncbi:MAG TPA: methyltransferase [Candidatus Choladousia intestinipullorum]|nr:methyltransferase [Candidatus Choladousia intestinipullorum]
MTHRERFYEVVTHGHPDRAVYDLSGSPQTNIDYEVTKKELARLLNITGEKQGFYNVDERILTALDIDTRRIGGMPTPVTPHCRKENGITYDSWGIGYKEIDGRMEICENPLRDCTIDEMMDYEFPDPEKVDRKLIQTWAEQAKMLHEQTDYAVVAEHPVLGVFELGCWMFGFDDYLYRLAGEPEMVHAFSQRVLDYQKKVIDIYYSALGRYIDCTTSGDDFGTQNGPFMSNEMFKEFIYPYFKERVAYTKQYTEAFYKHHTCGSVYSFIPMMLECGIDILNPIQPGVYMMECGRLKEEFGDRLTFWGGIDTQHLLNGGTEQEVKDVVKETLSVMDINGGYILSPAHTIQYDVPAQNLIALYRGADEYYEAKNGR